MLKKDGFKTFYALSIAWQLGFLIAAPVVGFLLLGYLGDNLFKTGPLLLILSLLASLTVTICEVYHLLTPLIEDKKND